MSWKSPTQIGRVITELCLNHNSRHLKIIWPDFLLKILKHYYIAWLDSSIIDWIAGIAAFIHIVAHYRHKLPCHKLFLLALFVLLFYPAMPTFSLLCLLYHRPEKKGNISKDFKNALIFAATIRAISGCLESPLQLIYQVWLIKFGIIEIDFHDFQSLEFLDMNGNRWVI